MGVESLGECSKSKLIAASARVYWARGQFDLKNAAFNGFAKAGHGDVFWGADTLAREAARSTRQPAGGQ